MLRHRPSPALVVAFLALVVALGGTSAVAAPAVKRMIDGKTVRRGSLPGDRVAKGSLPGDRIRRDSLGGAQIAERKLGEVPRARRAATAGVADSAARAARADSAARADLATRADAAGRADSSGRADTAGRADSAAIADAVKSSERLPLVRAAATSGPSVEEALAAAPELALGRRGPFELYAKCIVGGSTPRVLVLARTTSAGTLIATDDRGTLIEPATPERERAVLELAELESFAPEVAAQTTAYTLTEPGGAVVRGLLTAYVRSDGENGPLSGDERCLVTGTIGD